MTEQKPQSLSGETIIERGKEIVEMGNQRRLIIRRENGEPLIDVSLTVAVGAGVVFFFLPISWVWLLVAVVVAVAMKLRIEVLREVGDGGTIEMKHKNDEVEDV
ncbi:MAG: DUF4342 domain-containing protein [Anaerolineaceae bacterium]|nr:DUF4342 domain-containing protein [Anaerolineaceae bacterium]